MLQLTFSENAQQQMLDLATRQKADDSIIAEIIQHLETVMHHPQLAMEAFFPHKGGHLSQFHLFDQTGRMWSLTAVLRFTEDGLFVRAIYGCVSPSDFKS